jgi:hypothetical protein
MKLTWISAAYLSFFTAAVFAQQPTATTKYYPAKPLPGVQPPSGPMMAMPSVAPLFIENGGMSSSLMLVNNASVSAGATITVRDLTGHQVAMKHVVLDSSSQRELPLTELLSGATGYASVGNISVLQDDGLQGAAVNAQLLLTDNRNSIPAYIDEELAMPSTEGSSMLRGVTDDAQGPPLLAISNLADKKQTVTVTCLTEKDGVTSTQVAIAPHGTSLTAACSNKAVDSVDSYAQGLPQRGHTDVQGIEIVGDAGPGTLASFAFAPHLKGGDLVFSAVPLGDPKLARSSTMVYAGVPFGKQTMAADGLYTPHVAVTNFSDKQATIKITVAHSNPRPARDGVLATDLLQQSHSRTVTLKARESAEVVLENGVNQSGLLHSITVESDQPAGQVQSKVVSRGDGNLYQIELLGKDSKDMENAGGHPWTIQGDYESQLLLFNHSVTATPFNVYIATGDQMWHKKYVLAPSETRELSIRELIHDGIKDDKGAVIGASSRSGVAFWSAGEPELGTGRLLVSSRSAVSARNFSCGYTIIVCGMGISVWDSGIIAINDYYNYATITPQFCLTWGPGVCGGGTSAGGGGASYSWTIGDTTIASFNDPSDQYSGSPNLYGNNAGTTSATGQATENGCYSTGVGDPAPSTCDFTIIPSDPTATYSAACDGTQTSHYFSASISPDAGKCVYAPSGSTCSAANNNDGTLSGLNSSCNMDPSPTGTVTFYAGLPGGGGHGNQGSIHMGFRLKLGAKYIPHYRDISVLCP